MSLISCPECGKEISDKSEKCINCGYNLKKHIREIEKQQRKEQRKSIKVPKKVILIVVLILTLIGLGIGGIQIYRWYASKLVPNVVEMTAKQAQDLLTERGFDSEVAHEYTTSFEKGIVYEQSVAANSFYDSEDAIILMVSKGKTYTVPDIVGKNINDVEISELPHAIEYIYTDDKVEGYIVSVNKEVGTQYHDGDKVTIMVSKGMYTILPDIKQMLKQDATKVISDLGLKVRIAEEFSDVEIGKVIRYSPSKYGDKDETITLTISKGKGISVPQLKGYTEDKAKEILEQANVNYKFLYVYDNMDADCKSDEAVVTMQSASGVVSENTEVIIKVSKPAIIIPGANLQLNSVGGVDTYFTIENVSDKQIAYVTLSVKYYDKMGNPAECRIRDIDTARLEYTGPLNAGKTAWDVYWDAVIYDSACAAMKPIGAQVEFTDGTMQNLTYDNWYWYTNKFYGGSLND